MSRAADLRSPRPPRSRLRLGAWAVCLGVLVTHGAHAQPMRPDSAAAATEPVEVWVDLDLPPLGSLGRDAPVASLDLRDRIEQQQARVMAALVSLGAVEQGRVRIVRNALAVRLPAQAIPAARRLPGVTRVTLVRHLHQDRS